MNVYLANPRGFCAGVERAISIVERALTLHGAPIYVRHEVVHNKFVVDDLRHKGAVFIEELGEVPTGSIEYFKNLSRISGVVRVLFTAWLICSATVAWILAGPTTPHQTETS